MISHGEARHPQAAMKKAITVGPAANPRFPRALKTAMPISGRPPLSTGVTDAPLGWNAAEPRHPRNSITSRTGMLGARDSRLMSVAVRSGARCRDTATPRRSKRAPNRGWLSAEAMPATIDTAPIMARDRENSVRITGYSAERKPM
jgi:hypothetical protein